MRTQLDRSVFEMALVGLQTEAQRIEAAMASIRKQLGVRGKTAASPITVDGVRPKRNLSPAARKRIAQAQKMRWAAFHAKQGAKSAPKKTTAKKKMSPAAKAKLVANLVEARAARAAKAKAAA